MAIAMCAVMLTQLVITLASPYIQNPGYGNLGPKIGYLCAYSQVLQVHADRSQTGRCPLSP